MPRTSGLHLLWTSSKMITDTQQVYHTFPLSLAHSSPPLFYCPLLYLLPPPLLTFFPLPPSSPLLPPPSSFSLLYLPSSCLLLLLFPSSILLPFPSTQGILVMFLDRLSGWSSDGVQLPGDMIGRVLSLAKETPQGKNAVVQLVSGVT